MTELNIKNRTIFCRDNLDILEGINSTCIDLIYLDPPFNTNKEYVSPIASSAKGAGFKDIFRKEDVKDEWVKSIVLDTIFGEKAFKNEIIWHYFKPYGGAFNYAKNYDNIFFYTKVDKHIFNYKETFVKYYEKYIHTNFDNKHEWVHVNRSDIVAAIERENQK